MIRSLLWKEWREHRWKMLGIFALYLFVILAALAVLKRDALVTAQECLGYLALLIPGFVAIGTVTDEHSARTLDLLRGLPVPLRQLFFYKWIFGISTVLLPLAMAELFWYCLLPHGSSQGEEFFSSCLSTFISAASIYAWTIALGIRFTREHKIALVAVAVIVLGIISDSAQHVVAGKPYAFIAVVVARIILPVTALDHFYHFYSFRYWQTIALLIFQLAAVAALFYWPHRVFGRSYDLGRGRVGRVSIGVRIDKFRSIRYPILWKTWKEFRWLWWSSVIASVGLMLVVVDYFQSLFSRWNGYWFERHLVGEVFIFTDDIVALVIYAGLFLVIVMGVEIGMGDFDRGMDRFWRSRPIEAKTYFRRRFAFGWVAAMSALLLPLLLIESSIRVQEAIFLYLRSDLSPRSLLELNDVIGQASNRFLWYSLPLFSGAYAMAALFGAFFRQRVVAMVATVGIIVGMFVIGHELLEQLTEPFAHDESTVIWALVSIGGWSVMTLLLGGLALLAFQGDWKEKITAILHDRPWARPAVDHP